MDILKILSNKNRRAILRILLNQDMHISSLSRELKISKTVAMKHVNLLLENDLVTKNYIGRAAVIKIRKEAVDLLKTIEDIYEKPKIIKAKKGDTLLEVLKNIHGFNLTKTENGNYFIKSIDGDEGYYLFLANGKKSGVSIDKYKLKEDTILEFQKLVPVFGKKLKIEIE